MSNRSHLLTLSALAYFAAGLPLLFAPDILLGLLGRSIDPFEVETLQLLGCATFGFGMLNWMNRFSTIGGIFGRPIVAANLAYAGSAALLLVRFELLAHPGRPVMLAALGYPAVAVSFAFRFSRACSRNHAERAVLPAAN